MRLKYHLLAIEMLITAVLALAATPAAATFHEISIREVYPGSIAEPAAEYVELQMWSGGQNFVGGHTLRTYTANGIPTANLLSSDAPRGANQSTILVATPEAGSLIPGAADGVLSPSDQLDPSGGAVCWEAIDCVSWGSFKGTLPNPAGTPAAAMPASMALRRDITAGCASLLEPTDDRDNSAADFSVVFPGPRPNSTAPTEHGCPTNGGPQGGGSGDTGNQGANAAPQTTLKGKPPHQTHDRTPTFRFASNKAHSTFQCKLDSRPFKRCHSPFITAKLALGQHKFLVRARDDSGELDPSPARYSFRVMAPS